ncbi:nitroreductase family protein [Bacteroidota bacterium]
MIRKILKAVLPKSIIKFLERTLKYFKTLSCYLYDFRRYAKYSNTVHPEDNPQKLEARITAHYHVIEKGLSLKEIKPKFGQAVVNDLIHLLSFYVSKNYSTGNAQFISAIGALEDYIQFNKSVNADVNDVDEKVAKLKAHVTGDSKIGGTIEISKKDILKLANSDFEQFVTGRHSIRHFTDEMVDVSLINKAVKIASRTPSVCNRQSWKVYALNEREKIDKILSVQTGNRGFGHTVNMLLLVTSDLNYFDGAGERNEAFVDGGLFSMSLLYALYNVGLGAVSLNWAVEKKRDKQLRKMIDIKKSENVIMYIAVGHLPDKIMVPQSTRKEPDDIITIV